MLNPINAKCIYVVIASTTDYLSRGETSPPHPPGSYATAITCGLIAKHSDVLGSEKQSFLLKYLYGVITKKFVQLIKSRVNNIILLFTLD